MTEDEILAVQVKRLDPRAQVPRQAHHGEDAGWDLFTLEDTLVPTFLSSGKLPLTWIRTGIAVAIPEGYYGRIVGRSSAASKGFHVIEGIIDSGYRGELGTRVCAIWRAEPEQLANEGVAWRTVKEGESLTQLIVQKVPTAEFVVVDEFPPSRRGDNGFGSSG